MPKYKNIFLVDLSKGEAKRVLLGTISQGDALANRVGAIVYEDGQPVTLSGTCSGKAVLVSTGQTVPLTGVISGNTLYCELVAACYSTPGPIEVNIALTSGSETTTILSAYGNVRVTETGTIIDPGTIIPSVSALIEAIDAAVESIPADYSTLLASIAPAFSTDADYAAGDYVWYNGTLYRFTANHAAGSWTGTDAAAAVIENDLTALKSALDKTDESIAERRQVVLPSRTHAFINSSNIWSNSGYSYFIPVPENAIKIRVTATSDNVAVVALLSSNSHVNGQVPAYATGGKRVVIPAGETREFLLPKDCTYINTTESYQATVYTPDVFDMWVIKSIPAIDPTLSVSGDAADAKATGEIKSAVSTSAIYGFEFGGVNKNTGALETNTIRARSVLIPIVEDACNTRLYFSFNVSLTDYLFKNVVFYNNGTFVKSSTISIETEQWTYDLDGTFDSFRISFAKEGDADFTQEEINSFKVTTSYKILSAELLRRQNPYAGLKYAALGDSITYGYIPRNYEGYPGQLESYAKIAAKVLGMTFENYGISGSTMAYHSTRNPMSRRYNSLPDDADIITVMGGTNDIRNGIQLGSMSDRTDATFYGALHVVYGGLYKKYMIDQGVTAGKNKKIIAITPIKLLQSSASELGGTGTLYDFEPWVNAVKEVAAYYSIPVLDFYNLSGINPHLNETVQGTVAGYTGVYNPYITDGTHPTQEGQDIMAKVLIGFLKTLM